MLAEQVPSFPAYVTVPVWASILVIVLLSARRLRDPCSSFLLFAIWFRYCIGTFHQYTYPPIAFGFSLIALTSIATVVVGLAVVGSRALLFRRLTPLYFVMTMILISAIANQSWYGGINASFKWLYLLVIALAAYRAMQRHGAERIFCAMAVIFMGPVALQWISVPWGLKTTTQDGLSFFIGGYQHQQSLSIILVTFLVVTCLDAQLGALAASVRLTAVAVGLLLANYRTALIAAGLPAASLVTSKFITRVIPNQRLIAFAIAMVLILLVLVGVGGPERERFADFGVIIDKGAALIQPPNYFTSDERRLLSSRVYLWSEYLESYSEGDIRNIVIGFGPESWVGRFSTYAHNTFISYLYELGLFGVTAFIWVLTSYLSCAMRVRSGRKFILVSCHVGFIVLNLSTMALWTLEGLIMYGLVLGYTWYLERWEDEERLSTYPTSHPVMAR